RDPQAHHPRHQAAGRRGQSRGRRDREVHREAPGRCPMTAAAARLTAVTPASTPTRPLTQAPPLTQVLSPTTQNELIMQNTDEEPSTSIPADAPIPLDDVIRAIKDIADGRPVVVVDDADRENEGDIIFAASKATPELLAFTIRYGRGLICVPMLGSDLERLNLPQMTSQNQEHHGTAFTISVDARHGITTGISAADRAKTIQLLASPERIPDDLVRPGHVFPLRYAEGGVLRRRGHTEAAVDLAVLAGLPPVGVVCE